MLTDAALSLRVSSKHVTGTWLQWWAWKLTARPGACKSGMANKLPFGHHHAGLVVATAHYSSHSVPAPVAWWSFLTQPSRRCCQSAEDGVRTESSFSSVVCTLSIVARDYEIRVFGNSVSKQAIRLTGSRVRKEPWTLCLPFRCHTQESPLEHSWQVVIQLESDCFGELGSYLLESSYVELRATSL